MSNSQNISQQALNLQAEPAEGSEWTPRPKYMLHPLGFEFSVPWTGVDLFDDATAKLLESEKCVPALSQIRGGEREG